MKLEEIKSLVAAYQDFPQKGVLFRDLSPVLADADAFTNLIDIIASKLDLTAFDKIVAIDARGFVFGSAVAYKLQKGLVLCRKQGKLPGELATEGYTYEYASAALSIQKDRLHKSDNVVLIDDVLATGNTAAATARIIEKTGARLVGSIFVVEIKFLEGRKKLEPLSSVQSLIAY